MKAMRVRKNVSAATRATTTRVVMNRGFISGTTVFIRSIPPDDIRRGFFRHSTQDPFGNQWDFSAIVRISGVF
jgi:hypothetical protein